MTISTKGNAGFTILELLIATTVFSFVLLVATTGIIRIGNMYYKGVTVSKTQDAIRSVSDELSRSIQFAGGYKTIASVVGSEPQIFCLGDTRYTVYANVKNTPTTTLNSGLIAERISPGSDCALAVATSTKQMLGTNMRILNLEVLPLPGSTNNAWKVDIKIAYGDDDLLTHYTNAGALIPATPFSSANCKSNISGSNFCSTAQLDTVVKKRLN